MRNFIILMLLWMAAPSFAEVQMREQPLPMQCFEATHFFNGLKEKYEETNVFASDSVNHLNEDLMHQLWMNPTTQTWTFTVLNVPRNWVCIVASGQGFLDLTKTGI